MYENNCFYILFLHFIFWPATVLHKHFAQLTKLLQFVWTQNLHKDLILLSPLSHSPIGAEGPCHMSHHYLFPCTSRDHICGSKNSSSKSVSIHFATHTYGATKIEVYAEVFNTPCITSVEHEFPNRKLFQSYMHPLFSPILLLMIQALALAHNFWTVSKAQLQEVNNHYNMSHDGYMTMVVVEMCIKLMNSAPCAKLAVFFVVVYDKLLHSYIIYTLQLLPVSIIKNSQLSKDHLYIVNF